MSYHNYTKPIGIGKVVAVSGYFDPLHYGHIDYLQKAKALAAEGGGKGTLWVIVNSDKQAKRKKGKAFMPSAERVKMIRSLLVVDAAMVLLLSLFQGSSHCLLDV